MRLKNKIISSMKDKRVYGMPGDVVILVDPEAAIKLSNPKQVVVVQKTDLKSPPFPVLVSDLLIIN